MFDFFLIVHILFSLPFPTIQMQGFLEVSRQEKLKDTENLDSRERGSTLFYVSQPNILSAINRDVDRQSVFCIF